jgi:hypothetical protein
MALSPNFGTALVYLQMDLDRTDEHGREWRDEVAMFGSASLVLRGIIDRQPGDIDLLVTRRVWGRLLDRPGWEALTPRADDPPYLCRLLEGGIPASVFYAWRDPWLQINVEDEINEREQVLTELGKPWPCVPIYNVRRHKMQAISYPLNWKRDTHRADIMAIERTLWPLESS